MPSSFVLAPSASSSSAEELHLLPFALDYAGPAPVAAYFQPRPAPPGHNHAGATIAAFRGRALVAQRLELPRGYRGAILRADAVNASGAVGGASSGEGGRGAPLTPAPSLGSVSAGSAGSAGEGSAEGEGRVTRSSRARGAGQVALARPRAARPARTRARRIALSDDEDEGEDVVQPMPKKARADTAAVPPPTPATDGPPADDGGVEEMEEVKEEAEERPRPHTPDVPAIVVVSATPGASQPPPQRRLPTHPDPDADPAADAPPTPAETPDTAPKPEPERETRPEIKPEPRPQVQLDADEEPSDVRVLYPGASFGHITLWTPDAPMPGFVPGELDKAEEESEKDKEGEEGKGGESEEGGSTLGQLRRSWWRQGGAGEGGDEFVRGLGEWLGLGQIIHRPVYLED